MKIGKNIAAGILLVMGAALCASEFPRFSEGGPDAAEYGVAEHYPTGTPARLSEKKFMVGAFSHFDILFPSQTLAVSAHGWQFHRPDQPPQIEYFHAGSRYSVSDYLAHLPITGLLIAKDDQILFEAYQYGRSDRDRFTSQSMAKTFTGALMGVALSEHKIGSVDDMTAKYVPELKDSAYGKIAIRDLLHMSSGVVCANTSPDSIDLAPLKNACTQAAPAGTRFRYSAEDSQLLGMIIARSVNMSLAQYMDARIWKNIGSEANATWAFDTSGHQLAYCCFNAVLRDYARFGRLLAFDGSWNGAPIIPREWMMDATTVRDSDKQLIPGNSTPFFGYGYQVWIFPGERRMFALLGANGQRIFVDPRSKLVMVQTAVMEKAVDPRKDAEMIALWGALVRRFGNG